MKYNLKNNKPINQSQRLTRSNFCALKFREFCKRTDLHGFKYITMQGLSVAERSVWAVTVVISIICAAFLVVTAYRWYARNPIATVVETTQGVIWDVPFPAVTICDLNTVSRKAARNLSTELSIPENVKNITADFVFDTLKLVPLLHSQNKAKPDQKEALNLLQYVLDYNKISIENLFRKLSPATLCSNLMDRCMWKNTIYHCNQIFRHIFVAVNLCCTFNYYAVNDEANELKVFRFPTPRRVASCGYQTALAVITKTDPTDYYSTHFASLGSLVFVDNAYNVPDPDSPMRSVDPSAELVIAVSAEQTYATPGIRSFPVHDRQCYYNDEYVIPLIHQLLKMQETQAIIFYADKEPQSYFLVNFTPTLEHLKEFLTLLIANSLLSASPHFTLVDLITTILNNFSHADFCGWFPSMHKITFPSFNQYSFHNCMAVRKVQVLKIMCNCVPFYFPKKGTYRTCNFTDIDCLETVMNITNFNESDVSEYSHGYNESEKFMECLPECEFFAYPLQVAMGTVSDRVPLTGIDFYKDVDLKNRSVVNIFFNDLVATRYRRDANLNWQNVLAAFGGLLSLMLGFTVVSVFDFVLFFTLRVLYDSVARFFKCDDLHRKVGSQDFYYFINVEEQKRYGKGIPVKFITPKYKNYKDLERKQADLLNGGIRY